MNRHNASFTITLTALALTFAGCGKQPETKAGAAPVAAAPAATAGATDSAITTVDQKVSYGIGFNIGSGLGRDKAVTVDQSAIMTGLKDGLAGVATRVAEADLEAAFMEVRTRVAAAAAAEGVKQQAIGQAFLDKNKAKAGVTVTASGLQYEVITAGTGAKPTAANTVSVHYHGSLIDGTVFDSSVERGEPIEFEVTGVIPGWVEALQLMSVGSKWKLTIPSEIAYGARGKGSIPANSVLIFEVELLAIK